MIAIIAFWAGLACGAVVLIRHVYRVVQPPEVIGSAMSDDWARHMIYQTTKPGGASAQYGCDVEQGITTGMQTFVNNVVRIVFFFGLSLCLFYGHL